MEDYTPTPDKQDPKQEYKGFKKWFRLEWTNGYIFVFLIGLIGTIFELCNFHKVIQTIKDNSLGDGGGFMTIMGCLVCPAILVIVVLKGFIQYWNDLRNGTSR